MEAVSQTASTISSATQGIAEKVSENTGSIIQSISATNQASFRGFSNFNAFDPTIFEKPPTEFGKIDPFKDTTVITGTASSKLIDGISNDPEFDFKSVKPSAAPASSYNFQIKPSGIPEEFEELTYEDIELSSTSEEDFMDPVEKQRMLDAIEETKKFAGLTFEDITRKPSEDAEIIQEAEPVEETHEDHVIIIEETDTSVEEAIDESEDQEVEDEPGEEDLDDSDSQISNEHEDEDENEKRPKPKDQYQIHVVDFDANQARMNEVRIVIDSIESVRFKSPSAQNTSELYRRPILSEISGEEIVVKMHKTPTIDETSDVLLGSQFTDGSYSETIEEIAKQNFTNKMTAKEKILEIIRNKPAIMLAQVGKAVNEFDVQRVYKFLNLGMYQTFAGLQSIHT